MTHTRTKPRVDGNPPKLKYLLKNHMKSIEIDCNHANTGHEIELIHLIFFHYVQKIPNKLIPE